MADDPKVTVFVRTFVRCRGRLRGGGDEASCFGLISSVHGRPNGFTTILGCVEVFSRRTQPGGQAGLMIKLLAELAKLAGGEVSLLESPWVASHTRPSIAYLKQPEKCNENLADVRALEMGTREPQSGKKLNDMAVHP